MVARNNEMVSAWKAGNITSLMIDRAGGIVPERVICYMWGLNRKISGWGVFFANPSFADCGVCAGVLGGSSLPGTG